MDIFTKKYKSINMPLVLKKFNASFICFVVVILTFLSSCEALKPKKVDLRKRPVDANERARQNVQEGRGFSIGNLGNSSTNYEFSTSNPLWRASLEILDFIPMSTVDYSGGIIITDWYSDSSSNKSYKITVRFLSNEIQSNSIKIIVHEKTCKVDLNCSIKETDSKIKSELQKSILTKAANLELESKKSKKN